MEIIHSFQSKCKSKAQLFHSQSHCVIDNRMKIVLSLIKQINGLGTKNDGNFVVSLDKFEYMFSMKLGHCISKPLWYPIVSLRDVLSKRVCVLYHYLVNFKSKAFLPHKIMRIHQVQSWLATENDNQANNSVMGQAG